MSSRWHFNLAQALLEAGLDPALASHAEPTESFCNDIAQLVSRAYLQGQVSWGAADAVVNHLHFFILGCPILPKYAWGVYEAFDAGEYHPDSPELSDEAVTKAALIAQGAGEHA
ncbi:MAG TPA: hypothetical protein VFW60_01075 [Rhodanobacteraceae bacterium]|nr:hypothetical protein [Rhodanobacteraceae bacterium]